MLNEDKLTKILTENKILALKSFLQSYMNDKNVVGITLTGSYVHGDAGKHADLDVFIILKNSENRTRGNVFINETEIEFFINPIIQIERYFEQDYPTKINTAHMFDNCIPLYEVGSDLQRLITLAKKYMSKPLPEFEGYELYLCRYQLDDSKKDILDALEIEDQFTFEIIAGQIVNDLIKYFGKIKKFYPAKPKRLLDQLNTIDNVFSTKLQTYIKSYGNLKKRFDLLNECITYIEDLVGGPRPKSFTFTSELR